MSIDATELPSGNEVKTNLHSLWEKTHLTVQQIYNSFTNPFSETIRPISLSRRRLLIGIAATAGVLTSSAILESLGKGSNSEEVAKIVRSRPPSPPLNFEGQSYPGSQEFKKATSSLPEPVATPENPNQITEWYTKPVGPSENETPETLTPLEKLLFQGYSPTETTEIKKEVDKFLKPNAEDGERKLFMQNGLAWDATNFWSGAVLEEVKKQYPTLSPEEQQAKALLLLGLIRNESLGLPWQVAGKNKLDSLKSLIIPDPEENKQNLAQGLFQIQPDTAKEILGTNKYINLKDPQTAIEVGIKTDKIMSEKFGNLAPLAHYWGQGNVGNLIYRWLSEHAYLTDQERAEMEKDFDENPDATKKWIKREQINFIKLKNSGLIEEFSKKSNALTDKGYLPRVLASAIKLSGYHPSVDFNPVAEIGLVANEFNKKS